MEENTILTEDSWDDVDLSDVSDNEEPAIEQDQPEVQEEPAEETVEETPEAEPKAEELFTLKHLDEVRENVPRDEVIALAQKGMDYDRIRAKLDAPNPYEEFVKEISAAQGSTAEEFIDSTRAAMLAKKENIDISIAKERIRLDRREKEIEARERKQSEATAKADEAARKRAAEFTEFLNTYKDVDVKNLPKEVWDDVNKGNTLTNAYMKYENKQLKAQLAAERKNNENRAKTTGSQKSSAAKADEFDAMWYDGT